MPNPIVGMIVPPAGDIVPPEASFLYPRGIDFVARGLDIETVTPVSFDQALERLPGAVSFLLNQRVEAISLMGTSISFYAGWQRHQQLLQWMEDLAGDVPVSTMANAVVRALAKQSSSKIVVGSAYVPRLAGPLVSFLRESGFTILGEQHLNLEGVAEIHSIGTAELEALGSSLLETHPDADALFISCGGLRTAEATAMLQRRFAKPVISSSIAGCHDAVRLLSAHSTYNYSPNGKSNYES